MKNKKNKTPIFIIIGVIVVIIVMFLIFSNGSNEKIYEIGKDIEPGEYVLVGIGKNELVELSEGESETVYGYYAICTTKECNIDTDTGVDEIVKNDNITGKAYVILEEGQFLQTKFMKLYKADEYNSSLSTSISYDYKLGDKDYYKIGKDLSAGTYMITGDSYYYEICSKPTCDVFKNEIINNEFSDTPSNSSTITVENGQYLIISGTKPFTVTKK